MEYTYLFIIIKSFFFFSCISVFYVSKTLHAVFMLIASFVFAACICIFLEAYFVAFLLIIVYVGAVAVLFLFALMLINFIDPSRNTQVEIQKKYIVLFGSGILLIASFFYTYFYSQVLFQSFSFSDFFIYQSNTFIVSQLLYSYNAVAFILSGLILFVAMLGAIVLTAPIQNRFFSAYKQDISEQIEAQPNESIILKTPKIFKNLKKKIIL
jgi:NADH-quinone oxidoreductase subunit J